MVLYFSLYAYSSLAFLFEARFEVWRHGSRRSARTLCEPYVASPGVMLHAPVGFPVFQFLVVSEVLKSLMQYTDVSIER